MKAHTASAINAFTLLVMGGWGYSATQQPTALIPVFIGVILLVCNNGIRYNNKIMAHIAVGLTALILFALFRPLMGSIKAAGSGDYLKLIRVGLMMLTSAIALVAFILNFRAARKAKTNT